MKLTNLNRVGQLANQSRLGVLEGALKETGAKNKAFQTEAAEAMGSMRKVMGCMTFKKQCVQCSVK